MQRYSYTLAQTPCVSGQVCSCSVGVEVKKSCAFRQDGAARPKALAPSVLSPLIADMYHHAPARSQNRLHWTKMQSCPPSPHTQQEGKNIGENTCDGDCDGDSDKTDWKKTQHAWQPWIREKYAEGRNVVQIYLCVN